MKLHPKQLEAIRAPLNKCIRVVAGPGSGKTRVTVERMKYLQSKGVIPESIRLITFTNAAKNEAKGRLKSEDKNRLAGSCTTSHGFCREMLFETEESRYFGWQPISAKEQKQWLVENLKEKVPSASRNVNDIIKALNDSQHYGKNLHGTLLGHKKLRQDASKVLTVLKDYESFKKKNKLLDNTEQLVFSAQLLKKKSFAKKCSNEIKYLLVDEAQDLCKHKWSIVKSYAKQGTRVFCVGDPAQAIMGFSGAEVEQFIKFADRFSDSITIKLSMNYRSTSPIVEFTNQLHNEIGGNFNLLEAEANGEKPFIRASDNYDESIVWIAKDVKRQLVQGTRPCDIAILVLSNKQKKEVRRQLQNFDVPVRTRKRIRKKRKKRIRLGVTIRTVHKSKGREWQEVYVLDPRLKFHYQMDKTDLQCWWYVATTRAKSRLVCCLSKKSGYKYKGYNRVSKHFMDEMPSDSYEFIAYENGFVGKGLFN